MIVSDTRESILAEAVKAGVPPEDIVPVGTSVQEFIVKNKLEDKIDTVADFVGMEQTFRDAQNIGTLVNSSNFKTPFCKALSKNAPNI